MPVASALACAACVARAGPSGVGAALGADTRGPGLEEADAGRRWLSADDLPDAPGGEPLLCLFPRNLARKALMLRASAASLLSPQNRKSTPKKKFYEKC